MNRIRIILFGVLLVSLLAGLVVRKDESVDESVFFDEVTPGIVFGEKSGSPPHYESPDGAVAFNTYDVVPSIKGYAGPIKLLVVLDRAGTIIGIKVLQHRETPNYVHRMDKPEFLGQFIGKSVNDPIELDVDIDGITRATVSVRALTDSIRISSRDVASRIMDITIAKKNNKVGSGFRWIVYAGLFSFSLGLYFFTRMEGNSRKYQRARDMILLIGIIVTGVWLSSPFSILHVLNVFLFRISYDTLYATVLISTVISIIIAGRFYCGWMCPFGAVSEFLGRLPIAKWKLSTEIDTRLRNLKYVLLGIVMPVVLISGKTDFGNFETYVTLFSFHGNIITWILVVASLLLNIRVRRFWCRYLCPVAAFTGLLSISGKGYVSTGDCPIDNKPYPHISECIRCNKCFKNR